jgi:hypothetical protein
MALNLKKFLSGLSEKTKSNLDVVLNYTPLGGFIKNRIEGTKQTTADVKEFASHPVASLKADLAKLQESASKKLTPEESKVALEKVKERTMNLVLSSMSPSGEIKPVVKKATEKVVEKVDPVKKLTGLLERFKPLRTTTEELYSKERGMRFGKVEQTYKAGEGQAGFQKALGQLKGELPQAKVPEALKGEIQTTLGQGGVDEMFNAIQQHPYFNAGEKTGVQSGLAKVFSGEIPTQGELDGLEAIFGKEFADTLKITQPWKFNFFNVANEIGGTLKVLLSSFGDMSAVLRQNVMFAYRHPIKTLSVIKTSAKAAVSPKYYALVDKQITSNQYYPLAKKFKLALTDVSEKATSLNKAEEQFLVRWIQKTPIIGDAIKATERAFITTMNKARADAFYGLSDDLLKAGYDPIKNPDAFLKASKMVNAFSGRGNLGKALENATELTNLIAWSPRLIASRFQILSSPITYLANPNVPNPLKKEVAKTLLSYIGMIGTISGLAHLGGADVEFDPRSSDFLKIKVGNRRWDVSGGLAPYIRYITQVVSGQKKIDDVVKEYSRAQTTSTFLESKMSPIVSVVKELFTGKTYSGEKLTPATFAEQHFIPLTFQDVLDASKEVGWINAITTTGVPSFFGVSSQAYKTKQEEFKVKNYSTSSSSNTFKVKNYTR